MNLSSELDRTRAEQEALQWLSRLTSGAATEADRTAFLLWRSMPEHERAFAEALRVWKGIGRVADAVPMFPAGAALQLRRRQLLKAGALAAGCGAVFSGGAKLGFWPSVTGMMADYATAAGEQKRFTLSNVHVELNTRSALSLGGPRSPEQMTLSAGEAIFTVRPGGDVLQVSAGDGVAASERGVFSVRRGENRVQITCLEGRVDILRPGTLALRPSEQVACLDGRLDAIRTVETDLVVSWRRGELVFHDEPLENVVSELNRYRKGIVVIASRTVAERRVTGLFYLDRLDEALLHIQRALGIPMRQMSSYFVLLG